MNLSLNWLKEYVDIPKTVSPEELAKTLTMHTVEVEGIVKQAEKFNNVVVGKILEIRKHPNADRLQVTKTEVGGGKVLDIVCGAPNIEVGQMVPVALVGASLPNGLVIKEAEVRGEKSQGMLCASDELGLGEDHSGILILDEKAKLGQSFADYLGMDDVVLEVDNKSLSNRPDLWGHYGIARDLSAILGTKLKKLFVIPQPVEADEIKVDIEVKNQELCPRYMALAMSGITVQSSPRWLQERLIAVGLRPISNIVDATNYVMYEVGQPLHAFDRRQVDTIKVRLAADKEEIETLDGQKRELSPDTLVIADSRKPIAVAGVMGGANSEIAEDTREIIIESANFNYVSVRRTSGRLGLRTDASMRYEKGLDPNLCEVGLWRVAELIKKICPEAKIASAPVDISKFELDQGPISLGFDWIRSMIGADIKDADIVEILEKLGFEVEVDGGMISAKIPTWRATKDISTKEDILEEVARVYGFENIVSQLPVVQMKRPPERPFRLVERRIKDVLSGRPALVETYNYSFVAEDMIKKMGIDVAGHISLLNPIASNMTLLRQSLVPNILSNVKANQAKFESISLFEIGNVFLDVAGVINKHDKGSEKLPYQEKKLAIVLAGGKGDLFLSAKGIVDHLFDCLGLDVDYHSTEVRVAWSDKSSYAGIDLSSEGGISMKNIGYVARLDQKIAKNLGIKKEVVAVEINLAELMDLLEKKPEKRFEEFDRFPSVMRDLAFVLSDKIPYADVRDTITGFDPLIKSVELFDVYVGGALGAGMKSLAFHLVYQADRTLTAKEVDEVQTKLIAKIEEKFEAKLRN